MALTAGLIFFSPAARAAEYIWVEGEAAKTQNVQRHPWWYDKIKKAELSGGDYISNWSDKKAGEASYEFQVPAEGEYHFWVRANPSGTKLSYQLDGGEWKLLNFSTSVGYINLAADEKPDVRFLAWGNPGKVKLTQGAHTIAFKMHSENNNHGMLDCFLFTREHFMPDGAMKPGEAEAQAKKDSAGRWAFKPQRDEFSDKALLDLRYLNEKVAGESGFVTRSKDGNDFVLGNGKPARFWALNTSAYEKESIDLARHARFLAKRGVNMVRIHSNITPKDGNLMETDKEEREKIWRTVATMKKEGIYCTFSPYWAGTARQKPPMGVLDGGKGGNWGMLFFDKKLQEAYKAWMKQVLAEKNPHTGIPLSQDPGLAIIQIQNEDSLLFWTSQNIGGTAAVELRKQFGAFLVKKYGSLDKAKEAWGGDAPLKDDNFAAGEVAMNMIWDLTQRRSGAQHKRNSDQMQFFTETMYNFNKMIGDYLHNELGCKALINAGNWRAADNVTMLDAERYSYMPNEVMGVNRYFGGAHEGPNCGWAIMNGDKFTEISVLTHPRELPVNLKQVEGYPIVISESTWVPPQGYQSEGPFLIAAYQSLSGVDAYYWFATNEEDWRHPGSANGFLPSESKWTCATPMLMGQWPAAALFYRMGYVKQGEPVVYEQRALNDIWERKMPIIAEDAGYDPNRDKDNLSKESNVKGGVHPLAFLAGPVIAKYGGDPAQSKVADLKTLIDESNKTVKSITGELELNYGKNVCTLNAPKVQGVSGFLKSVGTFKLADVEITSGNDYANILAVSMDDAELKTSKKVLVQMGTIARPTGWKTKPATVGKEKGEQLVSFGKAPWQIIETDATLTIRNSGLKTAVVLDANGLPVKEIPLEDAGGAKKLKLPADAMYVVLQ
ncbi:MAG TPA: hypothetical protein VEK08_22635 [Planctomycetota bacterium]|nr:hypothetical protein [Planctomycetota bacterium]